MHTKFINATDMKKARSLVDYAFGEKSFYDWFFQKNNTNPENWLAFYSKQNVISVLCANPYVLNLHEKHIASAYITSVTTDHIYRGLGYFRPFLNESISILAEKYPIVFIKPIESKLYDSFGFAFYSEHLRYNINISELAHFKTSKNITLIDTTSENFYIEAFDYVYKSYLSSYHGFVSRTKTNWQNLLHIHESEGGKTTIVLMDNKPIGYMLYSIQNGIISVPELLYLNNIALETLLSNIYQHRTQANKVVLKTPSDDLLYLKLNISQYPNATYPAKAPFMMARILDVKQMLTMLNATKTCNENIVLKIKDDIVAKNNNNFFITTKHQNLDVEYTDIPHNAYMDISTLTQVLIGYISVQQAIKEDLIKVDSLITIEILQKIFCKKSTYINEEF